MRRIKRAFLIDNIPKFKNNLFSWAQQFETIVWLDSNNYKQKYSSYDCLLAADRFTFIEKNYYTAFDKLKEFQSKTNDYIFGYIAYDLKNDVENLSSSNFDGLNFSDLFFFQPKRLIFIKKNKVEFQYLKVIADEIDADFKTINNYKDNLQFKNIKSEINIKQKIQKSEYLQKVKKLIEHIKKGNLYEANFCKEFYSENSCIDPVVAYKQLNKISKTPFASFLKIDDKYVLCASPERFIRKEKSKVISQPIKGTTKRLINNIDDAILASNLIRDEKERAENIMTVDLVRNDLSKNSMRGKVKVEELCRLYSFEHVHQLVSTVVSKIKKNTHPVDIIKNCFPMGSMTGTPKISAMKILETLENTKRGLYSGTIGYFTPNNNFDFNVVIRSILYNAKNKYISYSAGGAITAKSNPEKEYEECFLKAKAMKKTLLK